MGKIDKQPKITIIVPITRDWALMSLFAKLNALRCDHANTELILYIDTDSPTIKRECSKYVEEAPFGTTKTAVSGNERPHEVTIYKRRDRIVEGHEAVKDLISDDSEFVFGVEDDSEFPADSIERLLPVIMRLEVGFVEGVQVGRWNTRYIGAWKVNNIEDPSRIISMPFVDTKDHEGGRFIERIDAGGWYCYMTKTALFKGVKARWHDECFGPDVCFGLDLRKQGFINYIDWSLIVGHNDNGNIILPEGNLTSVLYNRINGKWNLERNRNVKNS